MSRKIKDDQLLQEIGDALRPEDILDDPRWEQMAADELSEQERRHLGNLQFENFDPAQLEEAFRPMDGAMHDKLESLFDAGNEGDLKKDDLPVAPPISIRKKNRTLQTVIIFAASIAAAVLFGVILQPLWTEDQPPLPIYVLEVSSGDQQVRSSSQNTSTGAHIFSPQSLFSLKLRPNTRVDDNLVLRFFLEGPHKNGTIKMPFNISKSGTISLLGKVEDLFGDSPGLYNIVIIVARKGDEHHLPSSLAQINNTSDSSKWQTFSQSFTIAGQ